MNRRILIITGVLIACLILIFMMGKKKPPKNETLATPNVKEVYEQAVRLKKGNNVVKAKQAFQEIVKNHPDAENIASVQKELEGLNLNIIFSNVAVPGKTVIHEVAAGDTLGKIAKTYGMTVALLKRSNNIKGDVIRLGQKVRIWQGKFNIYVDKSQNKLILKDGDEVVKVYDVSTGENNSTPVGKFKIVSKLVNPVWFNRGVVVPPESPQNVLGTRWLGFDLAGYGIHGTTEPESIGKQVTAGCVRMRNEEVEEIYDIVPMGTEVEIVD